MPVARLSSVRLLFARGTTLLRDLDPGLDPSAIPGVLWDPRVQAYRTPAYRYRALRRELARRAVPFSDEVRVPQLPLGSWSPIELRPYQEAALWAWELAQRRAVVVLPKERENPARPRSDGARRLERVVPRSDTNPARAVAASHQAHVCRSRRLLRRRRPRARRADRRHLRERIPAHGPARQPLRPPRGRRGAPLWLWPARRGPRDVHRSRPAGTHGDPSAR